MKDAIAIRGAREHNLADIDLDLPREKLIVITGPSGSGKSSLAFDTIYAEGQRRYVASLSVHARRFLDRFARPDVDAIEGLSPTISVPQGGLGRHRRSTVATVTELHDHLRLLFARVGQARCPNCGQALRRFSVPEISKALFDLPERARLIILSPVVRGQRGDFVTLLNDLRRDGFARVEVDGEVRELAEDLVIPEDRPHTLAIIVDRLLLKPSAKARLAESLELAMHRADGRVIVRWALGPAAASHDLFFASRLVCPACDRELPELTPSLFSFNSPKGACRRCGGLGRILDADPDRVVPDPGLSLSAGAIALWELRNAATYHARLTDLAAAMDFSLETPWVELSEDAREVILSGSGERMFRLRAEGRKGARRREMPFEGVLSDITRRHEALTREAREVGDQDESFDTLIDELEVFMSEAPCSACSGARLGPPALAVFLGGRTIAEVTALSVDAASLFFRDLELEGARAEVAGKIIEEIASRLRFLQGVGLGYVGLDRAVTTLSAGEAQRVRLATQIGGGLVGMLYVLDEPSVGLHRRDNEKLIATLTGLRDRGNTVLVVEHDTATILAADHVVDLGPGAGIEGGRVIAQGNVAALMADAASLTGPYLSGRRSVVTARPPRGRSRRTLRIRHAATHNLRDVDVEIPLGRFVCVTGVSGSGKSSLVIDTLWPALRAALGRGRRDGEARRDERARGVVESIEGVEHLEKVIAIDQKSIGRTPRANAATYMGILPLIRELFAGLPEARMRGWRPGRFSFNVKGGRCEACQGAGRVRVPMHFLPDMYVTCEVCSGRRFDDETLRVRYRGRNIAEILDLSVREAREVFVNVPRVCEKLDTLISVGLAYLALGQPADTLSGGEAQRVKLARELARRAPSRTLYLLDEPTTGLHFSDVALLLGVLDRLVEGGASVLVIEHDLNVIQSADWVIDMGPEAGEAGGTVVAAGTPAQVAEVEASLTGGYLRAIEKSRDVSSAGKVSIA